MFVDALTSCFLCYYRYVIDYSQRLHQNGVANVLVRMGLRESQSATDGNDATVCGDASELWRSAEFSQDDLFLSRTLELRSDERVCEMRRAVAR